MDFTPYFHIIMPVFNRKSLPKEYVKVKPQACDQGGFLEGKIYPVIEKGKKFLDGCFTYGFCLQSEDGMFTWVSHQHIIFVEEREFRRNRMIVNCIKLKVKEDCIDPFIQVSKRNQKATLMEPDNLRFDIIQSQSDPTEFIFYEVFASPEGAAAHKETEHIKAWKEEAPAYLLDKSGTKYNVIGPEDPGMWKSKK